MIIFSVFNSRYTREQNEMQHQGIVRWCKRQGINFRETKGAYQGNEELGIMFFDNMEYYAKQLCEEFDQECYLIVSKSKAFLHYCKGPLKDKEYLVGIWTPGRGKGDYTEIDGAFYHCTTE